MVQTRKQRQSDSKSDESPSPPKKGRASKRKAKKNEIEKLPEVEEKAEKCEKEEKETPTESKEETEKSPERIEEIENSPDKEETEIIAEENYEKSLETKETEKLPQKSPEPKRQKIKIEPEDVPVLKEEGKLVPFEDDDDEKPIIKRETVASRTCPYLDTIDRGVLDFDFEKLCSVSLSHLNVYACLVCGKYFQGRGTITHAYTHSLDTDHRVFLNLHTLKVYCLPDNYEIIDSSLDDIKYVLRPTFTKDHISKLDLTGKLSRAYDGSTYHPGLLGLNNIKANDYCNAVLHALSHVPTLRSYFLREENYTSIKRLPGDKLVLLIQRFGELFRKLWNPRAFKAHVSPHEILQAVVLCSQKRFQITKQGDAVEFLSWLLNSVHLGLNGTKKTSSSVIYRTFRGQMRTYTRKVIAVEATEAEKVRLLSTDEFKERIDDMPFLYLTLDLPDAPLYRDELLQNIIPQVPLATLLNKFNGTAEKEYKTYNENFMKRFELTSLPPYLIVYIKRFNKNQWYVEKNPTIVNFPIMNVDLYEYLSIDSRSKHQYTTYDLLANIVHDDRPENGSYRIQLLHKGTGKWYELEDLHVKVILPQMITLTESYIQIWEMNTSKTRDERQGEGELEILSGGDIKIDT